jgi:hypothetical protein
MQGHGRGKSGGAGDVWSSMESIGARVSLRTLRKQPFQQTRVRWGDFPLSRIQSNYIKSGKHNNISSLG